MRIKDFDWKSHKGSKIVIYGTTVGGKVIYQCLQSAGIKVEFFCDRGKKYSEFCGCPVKEPAALCENRSYMVLVALTRSFDSACQYLEQILYEEVYSCINLIKNKKVEGIVYDENERELVADFLEKYPYYAGSSCEGIVLPSLEVFITERCTLRCRDCSHLIPKYQKPKDYDTEEIIRNLENTLQVVEKISDLNFLGGEPLLQKDLGRMLKWGYAQKRIGALTVISNGTVMPDEELLSILKETGARLRLSNYGKYSTKIKEIYDVCKERGISCYISDVSWTDMGGIYDRSYTKEELKEIFTDCPYSYCMLLLKGRIYRCAHVAHLNNLQIIDSRLHDSVDMSEVINENIGDKKRELREYLKIDYLQGCSYCNGIKNSIQGIEPGIQIER
ncbi:radical SAM protein [Parablautia intestinalis]|uniref:radical SAM protein n=1 Tax=Parablautia intestinalis TaxID=2320100 RepID=UPI00256F65D1|nr:radical SAM protein [Parablautia intestinalis]